MLRNKLTKQEVDVRFLDRGDVQKMGGDKVKVVIKVRNGIETEVSKKIQRLIKDSKIKVQAAIQGDVVRISGGKKDQRMSCPNDRTFSSIQRDTVFKASPSVCTWGPIVPCCEPCSGQARPDQRGGRYFS